MTNTDPATPIIVHGSPTPVMIAAALRSIIVGLGPLAGFMGHAGWFGDASPLLEYVGPAAAVIAFLWGQFATGKHAAQAAALADMLPNSKAQTK